MATTISTQDLENARRDIDDIGKAVNENVIVDPRYGADFKSLPMIAADGQALISTLDAEGQASINSFESAAQNTIDGWQSAISLITADGGIPALSVSDVSGKTQQEINNYSSLKFKETLSPVDFPSIADGLKNVVGGVVNLKLLENTYDLNEEVTIGRGHNIRGNGDYSVIKAPIGGTALKYKYTIGTLPYTHFGRVLENLRILGDGVNPNDTSQGGGTTTGYYQDASGHHGFTQQVTFDRHNIGMRINDAYVNSALNNFYRGNEVGLLLEGVTSHTEYSPYVRGNKTAGIKITGYMQNVHIVGGAAENNLGRAIWCTDLTESGGSIKRLTLDDVYTEANGNATTGVPAIEIDYHPGMHVDVRGGVYSYTNRSGVFTGAFKWGNSVSINGSQMLGFHYAKTMKIENVWFGARLNTSDSESIAVLNGLVEPVVLKGIHCNSYSEVNGPIFQPYNLELSKISEVGKHKSTANYTYPFGAQVSGTTVRVSDSTHDFGAGAWLKATFLDVGGNNANYLELTNVLSEDIGKVLTFALRADRDMSIGIIAVGSKDGVNNQTHQAYFELKADKTYVLSSLAFKSTGGVVGTNQRYRLFSTSGAGSISYFPLFACTTPDVFEAFKIADNLCKGTNIKYDDSVVVAFNPPSITAGSTHTTTVSKKGVKVGDVVQATFSIYDASIEVSAVVSAVDEVTVSFKNTSGSPVDLSSGNISIFV